MWPLLCYCVVCANWCNFCLLISLSSVGHEALTSDGTNSCSVQIYFLLSRARMLLFYSSQCDCFVFALIIIIISRSQRIRRHCLCYRTYLRRILDLIHTNSFSLAKRNCVSQLNRKKWILHTKILLIAVDAYQIVFCKYLISS